MHEHTCKVTERSQDSGFRTCRIDVKSKSVMKALAKKLIQWPRYLFSVMIFELIQNPAYITANLHCSKCSSLDITEIQAWLPKMAQIKCPDTPIPVANPQKWAKSSLRLPEIAQNHARPPKWSNIRVYMVQIQSPPLKMAHIVWVLTLVFHVGLCPRVKPLKDPSILSQIVPD